MEWRLLQSFVFSTHREAVTTITPIRSEWVRIEVKPLVLFRANWYRAGWFNPVLVILGKDYLQPSRVVPFQPSVFRLETEYPYKIRFQPVPYFPKAVVKVYRSLEPAPSPNTIDGGQYG
jgi:hypothetical protein